MPGGVELAYKDPKNRNNVLVQTAVNIVIHGCSLYDRRMPLHARRFLANFGNSVNDEVLNVTPIEVWNSTKEVADGFKRRQDGMTAKVKQTILQSERDSMYFDYACVLYPRRWATFHELEICATAYRRSNELMLETSSGKISVWDQFAAKVNSEADLQNLALQRPQDLFSSFYHIYIGLRSEHPEYITPVAMLLFPSTHAPHGTCSFLPGGLPQPPFKRITPEMVASLTQNMAGSQTLKSIAAGADVAKLVGERSKQLASQTKKEEKKQKAAQAKAAKAKAEGKQKAKARPKVKGRHGTQSHTEIVIPEKEDLGLEATSFSFLLHWTKTKEKLLQIDETQSAKLVPFEALALACSMGLKPMVTVKGVERQLKGWSDLRKLYKEEFYRTAALAPRPSDPDFHGEDTYTYVFQKSSLARDQRLDFRFSFELYMLDLTHQPQKPAPRFLNCWCDFVYSEDLKRQLQEPAPRFLSCVCFHALSS